jgi:hypothetical protein
MKIHNLVLTTAMLVVTSTFAFANSTDTNASLTQIVTEAKKTQLEAKEISTLLKAKKPDFDRVTTKINLLEQHAAAVRDLITAFEANNDSLTPTQKLELDRMKTTAEIVRIFVHNKKEIIASGEASQKKSTLRAKANGIAMRAEMMQQSALRIRS